MRWLIRTIKQRGNDSATHQDSVYDGEVLSVGRAPGQTVFLSDLKVALEHAEIIPTKRGRFRIESLVGLGIKVNGKSVSATVAAVGSTIEIGSHRLELVKPPAGYDAALQVSQFSEDKQSVPGKHKSFRLSETRLNKRSDSWLLFIAFLTIGLAIPLVGHLIPGMQQHFRAIPLIPSDRIWDPGELHSAHHLLGQDCTSCHRQAFTQVSNPDCQVCHTTLSAHADITTFNQPALLEARCDYCHREHNGADGLIRKEASLCTDCHEDLNQTFAGVTQMVDVGDFNRSHPQFSVQLPRWDENDQLMNVSFSLNDTGLREQSNLKFPHAKHLRPEGLNSASGKQVLECADCHQTEPGGGKMLPVDFETMCQDCHRLGFDTRSPDRQVPHAKVSEILFMLEEYYANKALVGGYDDITAPAVVRQRRRPGQRLTPTQQKDVLAWARSKSLRVGEDLFEGQACSVCHRVEKRQQAENITWYVQPVRVAGAWFPGSVFKHEAHVTMQCGDCHAAEISSTSDDILMPGIDNCRTCHGDVGTFDKVPSPCLSCHTFHAHADLWPEPKEAL